MKERKHRKQASERKTGTLVLLSAVECRALRRAGRAAAAEFFVAPPPPIYVTGAPNAAAAEILSQRRRESAASVEFGTSLLAARRFLYSRLGFSDCPCE